MIAFTRFDFVALIVIVILLALSGPDASPRPPVTESRSALPIGGPPQCEPHSLSWVLQL